MRLLLDTNVLLDFYLSRPGFCGAARELFSLGARGKVELWASAKSFTDVFYVGRKAVGSQKAQQLIEASLEHLKACSIDEADVRACLAERWDDLEDCLVARAASNVHADLLVTRDARGFDRSAVPTATPEEALSRISGWQSGARDMGGR